MSEVNVPPREKWFHRNLWSALLTVPASAAFTALFAWLGPQLVSVAVPAWVYVALAVALVVVVSVVVKPLRRMWKRAGAFVRSIRVTTELRIQSRITRATSSMMTFDAAEALAIRARAIKDRERETAVAAEQIETQKLRAANAHLQHEQARLKQKLHESNQSLSEAVEAAQATEVKFSDAYTELWHARRRITQLEGEVNGLRGELSEAQESLAAGQPTLPRPRPRWAVEVVNAGEGEWVLRNLVARSVAREVRLDIQSGFRFESGAHWEDLSGENAGELYGEYVSSDRVIAAYVQWYDEDAAWSQELLYIAQPVPFS